jgi:hypothetical protein
LSIDRHDYSVNWTNNADRPRFVPSPN